MLGNTSQTNAQVEWKGDFAKLLLSVGREARGGYNASAGTLT